MLFSCRSVEAEKALPAEVWEPGAIDTVRREERDAPI